MQLTLGTTTLKRASGTLSERAVSESKEEKLIIKINDKKINFKVIYLWFSIPICAMF